MRSGKLQVAIVAVLVGGWVGVGTALAVRDPDAMDLPSPGKQAAASEVTIASDVSEKLRGEIQRVYGLDLSRAISLPAPAGARNPDAEDTDARWTLVTGDGGVCLAFSGRSLTCGATEAYNRGEINMKWLPATNGPSGEDSGEAKIDPAALIGKGPEVIRGAVPSDVVRVTAYDSAGNELASTDVRSQVYELTVPDARQTAEVRVVRKDGSEGLVVKRG